jgi:hypothetical protein
VAGEKSNGLAARKSFAVAKGPEHPVAQAMQWVANIFAAALMMSLPGFGGLKLDRAWGTTFIGPVGFVFGLVCGMWYLIAATRSETARKKPPRSQP